MFLQDYFRRIYTRLFHSVSAPFNKLLVLLFFSLLLFSVYSFREKPFRLFGKDIRQAGLKEMLYPPVKKCHAPQSIQRDESSAMDTTKQHFLLIGDSMLEGLGVGFNDYCRQNGHTMYRVIWYASSTLWFGSCDTIAYFIKEQKPTYVILCIGGNELSVGDILQRDKYVKRILKQVGNLKYIWVGPPNWKDDTGINDLIENNVGRKRYFPSKNLTFERKKDGAHPTLQSARKWMDSLAVFVVNKSKFPILLNPPTDSICKKFAITPTLLLRNAPTGL